MPHCSFHGEAILLLTPSSLKECMTLDLVRCRRIINLGPCHLKPLRISNPCKGTLSSTRISLRSETVWPHCTVPPATTVYQHQHAGKCLGVYEVQAQACVAQSDATLRLLGALSFMDGSRQSRVGG